MQTSCLRVKTGSDGQASVIEGDHSPVIDTLANLLVLEVQRVVLEALDDLVPKMDVAFPGICGH